MWLDRVLTAGALASACVVLAACNGGDLGGAVASGQCEPVDILAVQGGEHLIGDQDPPVPYNSVPPTSGWHASGAFEIRVFDDPLPEPLQVSVLEVGGAVATYRDLAAEDQRALEELAAGELAGRLAVTPYDKLEPGEVALTAWGTLQRCNALDLQAVRAFVDTYAEESPEVPDAHQS
jgi:hypothetical protein